jgi:hypothetical protein
MQPTFYPTSVVPAKYDGDGLGPLYSETYGRLLSAIGNVKDRAQLRESPMLFGLNRCCGLGSGVAASSQRSHATHPQRD